MKIKQQPMFQPITITLETNAEAEALAQIVDKYPISEAADATSIALCLALSNWFTQIAQFGGPNV